MNRTRRAFYSFLWVGAGAILANVFGYLLRIVLARNLTVAEYGLVYAIMALFGLVGVFLHWGLGESLSREAALTAQNRVPTKLKGSFLWAITILYASSTFVAVMGWIFARYLAGSYFQDTSSALPIMIYAVSILLSPIAYVVSPIFIGRGRPDLYVLLTATQSFFLLVGAWLFLSYGVAGIMAAYAVTMILLHLFFYPLLGRLVPGLWRVRTTMRIATAKRLIRYGLPVMVSGVAGMLLSSTDTVLLTYFSSLDEVGLYQAALPTANLLLFLLPVITTVLLPLLTDLWRRRESALLRASVRDLYGYVFLATTPIIASTLIFPDLILNLLFGAEYLAAAWSLRFLALSSLFLTLNAVTTAGFSAIGKPALTSRVVIIGAVLNVAGNLLLIPRYGSVGAAFATFVSSLVIFLVGVGAMYSVMRVQVSWYRWFGGIIGAVLFIISLAVCRWIVPIDQQILKAFVSVAIAGTAYIAALFMTRTVTVTELRDLFARISPRPSSKGGS